ncbi:MAG: hypothetical protein IJD92_00545 [Bacilli bacterium]|nr:hypothetical protein [Bacilli bacterium]
MIKKIFIVIGLILGLILFDSIQAIVYDNNPIIKIKEYYNGGDINYKSKGILVDTINCSNGKKDTVIKGFSYSCNYEGGNYILMDETKEIKDFVCDFALEQFYQDENYNYYWNCIKNKYMIVKYDDGTKKLISEVLKQKHIDIQVLDKFNISYIKYPKETYNKNYKLNIVEEDNCNLKLNEYYKYEDRTVYTVCLNEIYLERKNSDGIITLKYHLENVNQTFDRSINELVTDAIIDSVLRDGGTTIYKKDNYTVIVCNTIDGNKDIYIGNKDLKYEQGYCK